MSSEEINNITDKVGDTAPASQVKEAPEDPAELANDALIERTTVDEPEGVGEFAELVKPVVASDEGGDDGYEDVIRSQPETLAGRVLVDDTDEGDSGGGIGNVLEKRTPVQAFVSPVEAGDPGKKPTTVIQPLTTASRHVKEVMSRQARKDPDCFDTHGIPPRSDSRGVDAFSAALLKRANENKESGPKAGDAPEVNIWAWTNTGLEARLLMEDIERRNAETRQGSEDSHDQIKVKAVIACESDAHLKAMESGGMFKGKNVKFDVVDVDDPGSFNVPEDTNAVLIGERLSELPASMMLQHEQVKARYFEAQTSARIVGDMPLMNVSKREPGVRAVDLPLMTAYQTAENPELLAELYPQLAGRIQVPEGDGPKPRKLHFTPFGPLDRQVGHFFDINEPVGIGDADGEKNDSGKTDRLPPATLFNYAPNLAPIVQRVVGGAAPGSLAYICGPMRDGREPLNKCGLAASGMTYAQGPYVLHTLEVTDVLNGVSLTGRPANVSTFPGSAPGKFGRILIDLGADADQANKAKKTFSDSIVPPIEQQAQADSVIASLTAAVSNLRRRGNTKDGATDVGIITNRYKDLIAIDPQMGRSHLALDLSRTLIAHHQPKAGLEFAEIAKDNTPHFSSPYVLMANAEIALGHYEKADQAINTAKKIGPRNPEVYVAGMRLASVTGNRKLYIDSGIEYLTCAPEESPEASLGLLQQVCEKMKEDWLEHQNDTSPGKTIVVEDLITGKLRVEVIPVNILKQMQAARMALSLWEVAEKRLSHKVGANPFEEGPDGLPKEDYTDDAKVQTFLGYMKGFEKLYNETRFYGPPDPEYEEQCPVPIPLSEMLAPPNRNEVWYQVGSLLVGDEVASPGPLLEWEQRMDEERPKGVELYDNRFPEERKSRCSQLLLGNLIEHNGNVTASPVHAVFGDFTGNITVTGGTGGGKTVTIAEIFCQATSRGVHGTIVNLGDKPNYATMVERMEAEGVPWTFWDPADINSPAVSIEIFDPMGIPLEQHINDVVNLWETAYDMPDPFPSVLKDALQELYKEHGWDAKTGKIGTLPTSRELQEKCQKEVDSAQYSGIATNIASFFWTRNKANQQGWIGAFFETGATGTRLDCSRMLDSNIILSLHQVTNMHDKHMMALAYQMRYKQQLRLRGIQSGGTLLNLFGMDEAEQALKSGVSEVNNPQRVQAIETFVRGFQLREFGALTVVGTQVPSAIDPHVISESGLLIGHWLNNPEDQERMSGPWKKRFSNERQYDFGALDKGQAIIWKRGPNKPLKTQMEYDESKMRDPKDPRVQEAIRRQRPLPLLDNGHRVYTHKEGREVELLTQKTDKTTSGMHLFAHITAIAALSEIEMPTAVPEHIRRYWGRLKQEDPDKAEKFLTIVANEAVDQRRGYAFGYPPDELTLFVTSHMKKLLNEVPGSDSVTYASHEYGNPAINTANTWAGLSDPRIWDMPGPNNPARPLRQRLPGYIQQPGQKVSDVRLGVLLSEASPAMDLTNAEKVKRLLYSAANNFWVIAFRATGIPAKSTVAFDQRHKIAEWFGYRRPGDPWLSSLERVLSLGGPVARMTIDSAIPEIQKSVRS